MFGARSRSRQICLEQIWTDAVRPQGETRDGFIRRTPRAGSEN